MLVHFALWPMGTSQVDRLDDGSVVHIAFQLWQVLTYGFLHGSPWHLAFNMFALWMFGGPVEEGLGARRFALLYLSCVLGAAAAQLCVIALFQPGQFYPTVGASGGVFGVMLAFAMLYPQAKIVMLYFPVPMRAPIAVAVFIALELFFGITGTQAGVAHFAHLGGAIVGFVLIQYWRRSARG
jgi:membrane associated rhomboid family serine protease